MIRTGSDEDMEEEEVENEENEDAEDEGESDTPTRENKDPLELNNVWN